MGVFMKQLFSYIQKAGDVYIYGAGRNGRILAAFLNERDIPINGFLVTSISGAGDERKVLGYPVFSVDNIGSVAGKAAKIIVSVAERTQSEIGKILNIYGVEDAYYVSDGLMAYIESKLTYSMKYPSKNNINVLIYHRVGNYGAGFRGLTITKELFEEQIIYLKENYKIIRADDDWENISEQSIVLTFDDGYKDFYHAVVPLLEKHKIPATVFVSTGNIDTRREFWGDELERVLRESTRGEKRIVFCEERFDIENEKQIETAFFAIRKMLKEMKNSEREQAMNQLKMELGIGEMPGREDYRVMSSGEILECSQSPYVTIGAHTVNHCCLSYEEEEQQRWEMEKSKDELERIIGRRVDVFAYPYGESNDYTDKTIEIARAIGFKKVFAANPGLANHIVKYGNIPRNDISKVNNIEAAVRLVKLTELCFADPMI